MPLESEADPVDVVRVFEKINDFFRETAEAESRICDTMRASSSGAYVLQVVATGVDGGA